MSPDFPLPRLELTERTKWSAANRDFEREIIPMTPAEGMGLVPWGALGMGLFQPASTEKKEGRTWADDPAIQGHERDVGYELETIANRKGTAITSVALAYVLHKAPYVFPVCGGRKVTHLEGNIKALGLELDEDDIAEIEKAYEWNAGFPHNFLTGSKSGPKGPGDIAWANVRGIFDLCNARTPSRPGRHSRKR